MDPSGLVGRQSKEETLMGVSMRACSRWGVDFGKMVCSWVMIALAMVLLSPLMKTSLVDGS